MSRRVEQIYEPTKAWLRLRYPKTKKEIVRWYKREKRLLDIRRHSREGTTTTFEAYTIIRDRDSHKEKKRSKYSETTELALWPLSEQDYEAYLAMLDRRYAKLKKEFNEKLKLRKRASSKDSE